MKPEPVYKEIGANIRIRRRQADISQEVMAQHLSISRATLANIETGRQRILVHQLYRIAAVLKLLPGDLLPLPRLAESPPPTERPQIKGSQVNSKQAEQVLQMYGASGDAGLEKREGSDGAKRNLRRANAKAAR